MPTMSTSVTITPRSRRPPAPQDNGWSWMIVLGVFIYSFIMIGVAKSYGLFLLSFLETFGVSVAYASLPLGLSALLYAGGAPVALILADRFGTRSVVIFGAIVGSIGICISSALISMAYVTVFFGIFYGVGNSTFYGNGLVMLGKYFTKRRSLATGLGLAGASIGQFAMPPLIEYLLETYGLGGTLLIIGGLYANAAVSGALFRPITWYAPREEVVLMVKGVEGDKNQAAMEKERLAMEGDVPLDEIQPETKVFVNVDHGDDHADLTVTNGKIGATSDVEASDESANLLTTPGDSSHKGGSADPLSSAPRNDVRENKNEDDEENKELSNNERAGVFHASGTDNVSLVEPEEGDASDASKGQEKAASGCCSLIAKVFDFSVLESYVTRYFTLTSFLCFFGYFNFVLFLPPALVDKGFTNYDKAFLISLCGVGDLISRVTTGFFADLNIVPRYQISGTACILCSCAMLAVMPADTFGLLCVLSALYGYTGGAYVSLLSVVLVDLVGLAMMSKNLAVLLLIQGSGAAVGQIILGWLKDETGSYDIVILICFVCQLLGGILHFGLPFIKRREKARLARLAAAANTDNL